MDNRLLKRFVSLKQRKRKFQEALKLIDKDLDALEPLVITTLTKAGVESINVNGVTLYTKIDTWAHMPIELDRAEIMAGLKRAGLDQYVNETYNSPKLSAYIRDIASSNDIDLDSCEHLRDLGITLPPELEAVKDILGVSVKLTIGTRTS